jgi:hypothetical protein
VGGIQIAVYPMKADLAVAKLDTSLEDAVCWIVLVTDQPNVPQSHLTASKSEQFRTFGKAVLKKAHRNQVACRSLGEANERK